MAGIHHDLRSMVERLGPGVLQDKHEFWAALDDYLTEGDATPGEMNLLRDTVRLGGWSIWNGWDRSGRIPRVGGGPGG